jgi:integrase
MSPMAIHKRGSGTVYRRGRIWWIQYCVDGLPMRESSGYTEKKDADNLLKQRIGDVASGRSVPGQWKATVDDLVELVVRDSKLRNLRDVAHIVWRYKANTKTLLGSLLASRVGTSQIRHYIERRQKAGAGNATINRELAIVRRGFKLGSQEEPPLVFRQPAIPRLEEDNARQGFIERDQYERLLAEMPENLRAFFVCAYHTGARKGELRKIQWGQVDFDDSLIRLEARQTKGKTPRSLPIYGDMERWLRRQQETAPAGNLYVFHGARGRPIDNHLRGWVEASKRAGFPGLLPHDLRRSAVRNMKRAGVQDVVAMKISGHKTRLVFDRYNIVDDTDLAEAGGKLQAYFERPKPAKLKRVK